MPVPSANAPFANRDESCLERHRTSPRGCHAGCSVRVGGVKDVPPSEKCGPSL